jgi:hypothetical protein
MCCLEGTDWQRLGWFRMVWCPLLLLMYWLKVKLMRLFLAKVLLRQCQRRTA